MWEMIDVIHHVLHNTYLGCPGRNPSPNAVVSCNSAAFQRWARCWTRRMGSISSRCVFSFLTKHPPTLHFAISRIQDECADEVYNGLDMYLFMWILNKCSAHGHHGASTRLHGDMKMSEYFRKISWGCWANPLFYIYLCISSNQGSSPEQQQQRSSRHGPPWADISFDSQSVTFCSLVTAGSLTHDRSDEFLWFFFFFPLWYAYQFIGTVLCLSPVDT
jgi:hypothetical protein